MSFPRSPRRVPRKGRVQDRGRGQVILFPPGEAADSSAQASPPFLARMLPGVIAGAADLDPAAVLTATVVGATYGLSVAWVVLLCIPILRAVFGVAARIGHETRLGLVKLVREHFGKKYAIALACMVVAVNVMNAPGASIVFAGIVYFAGTSGSSVSVQPPMFTGVAP